MQSDIKRHLRVVSRHLRTAARHSDVEWRRPVEIVTEHFRRRIELIRQVDVDAVARVCTQDERFNLNARLEHSVTVEIFGSDEHDAKKCADISRARAGAWHYATVKDKLSRRLRLPGECFLRSYGGDVVDTFLRCRKICRTGRVRHVVRRYDRIVRQGREFRRRCSGIIGTEDAPQTLSNSRLVKARAIEIINAVRARRTIRTLAN